MIYEYSQSKKPFEVKPGHLALMKSMFIEWDDNAYEGAPCVDIKQPYGNSFRIGDIREIIFDDYNNNPLKDFDISEFYYRLDEDEIKGISPNEYQNLCLKYHREMQIVLQIVCSIGSIEVGEYVCYRYPKWKKI